MIMFIVVTGLQPFADCHNPVTIARRVVKGDRPRIPAGVNPAYTELIEQCWAQSPDDRPDFPVVLARLGEPGMLEGIDAGAVKSYQARLGSRG
jgi:hypothetical protein